MDRLDRSQSVQENAGALVFWGLVVGCVLIYLLG